MPAQPTALEATAPTVLRVLALHPKVRGRFGEKLLEPRPFAGHAASMYAESKRLLLFDGVCNFCNEAVLFVVDRDPSERFVFAALQSDVGVQTLRDHGLVETNKPAAEGREGEPDLDTIVLIEGNRAYTRSTAALHVAKGLKWPWPILYYVFIWLPVSLRDAGYSYFARHRYAWFGKSDQCRIPTPELRRRILTASTSSVSATTA